MVNPLLNSEEINQLCEELETAQNPFFIYDDDADGLSSFLLLYRKYKKGRGYMLKSSSVVDVSLAQKVAEVNADKVFILDIPLMEQEFVDKVKLPIFWIDHHPPQKIENVHYYNPRLKDKDAYIPTNRMVYQVTNDPADLWITTAGCLGDWHMPDFMPQFIEKYPHLLAKETDLADAIYKQPVGKLVKILYFLLKGKHSEILKSIKVLTRIESPDEILKQETAQGKFIWKRFEQANLKFEALLKRANKEINKNKLVVFSYDEEWSFTTEISNELSALNPNKTIIICRNKSGEMKCSLRSKTPVLPILTKSLEGIEGRGGGHPEACGAVIKEKDWERFLDNFRREMKESSVEE
ncbi:DHH family phosphoesterase [Candidatus Woesearchaeota archaeon]|nr:DHH family phosphoesterase [Candidatus Woesearchaeota archaeon]